MVLNRDSSAEVFGVPQLVCPVCGRVLVSFVVHGFPGGLLVQAYESCRLHPGQPARLVWMSAESAEDSSDFS